MFFGIVAVKRTNKKWAKYHRVAREASGHVFKLSEFRQAVPGLLAWFPPGQSLSPGEHVTMSGNICNCHNLGKGSAAASNVQGPATPLNRTLPHTEELSPSEQQYCHH